MECIGDVKGDVLRVQ